MNNNIKKSIIMYNPYSTGFKNKDIDKIYNYLKEYNINSIVIKSEHQGHLQDIIKALDNHDTLIITLGGDGTVNEAYNAFNQINQKGLYTHIPTGTTNDMAKNLDIYNKNIEKQIESIINGEITTLDSFKINDKIASYTAAFGYVSHIPYVTNLKFKKHFHHAGYILTALKEIIKKPKRYNITCEYDNQKFDCNCIMGIISNSYGFGGVTLYPDTKLNDGNMELLLLKNLSPKVIPKLFNEYINNTIDLKKYTDLVTVISSNEFKLKFNDEYPNYPIDIDGENSNILPNPDNNIINAKVSKKIKVLKSKKAK